MTLNSGSSQVSASEDIERAENTRRVVNYLLLMLGCIVLGVIGYGLYQMADIIIKNM